MPDLSRLGAPLLLRLALATILALSAPSLVLAHTTALDGHFSTVWGDPRPDSGETGALRFFLAQDDGTPVELQLEEETLEQIGGFLAWQGRHVTVQVENIGSAETRGDGGASRRVVGMTESDASLRTRGASTSRAVSGSQPWLSLMCKFPDIADEPRDLVYFQNMYSASFGGLDDYWRKNSYDRVDLRGSMAYGWVELPRSRDSYLLGSGTTLDAAAIFDDCTAAADDAIDFSNGTGEGFAGIHLMLNAEAGCCAWAGGFHASLDGVEKLWRVTWVPPFAYQSIAIVAHEMGHGFGLPHSNNFDDDGSPYDSPWDVMSSANGYGLSDLTYGTLPKHNTAHHKHLLGWLGPDDVFVVRAGSTVSVQLDGIAIQSTEQARMIKVPIPGTSRWFTVEARDLSGYDQQLPDAAVIISEVDPTRSEPAWAVDTDLPPAPYGNNEGTMFRVGETYVDEASGIRIRIEAQTNNGFQVEVTVPSSAIFASGFEDGSLSAWL